MKARSSILVAVMAGLALAARPQVPEELIKRWVGTYEGRPLHLDFYADTLLVLNDVVPLNYEVDGNTLRAWGDTAFTVSYWFAMDRLLLETIDSTVITMAQQDPLARPLVGRWRGSPIASNRIVEMIMYRGGAVDWLRPGIDGRGRGEWDRASRLITFTWEQPDSTEWLGRFDPAGGALLFDSLFPSSGPVILRRIYRW